MSDENYYLLCDKNGTQFKIGQKIQYIREDTLSVHYGTVIRSGARYNPCVVWIKWDDDGSVTKLWSTQASYVNIQIVVEKFTEKDAETLEKLLKKKELSDEWKTQKFNELATYFAVNLIGKPDWMEFLKKNSDKIEELVSAYNKHK